MNLLQEKKMMNCWKFTAEQKLLFIGDSITDAFRLSHPDGRAHWLGAGYVAVVEAALANLQPGAAPEVVNRGVSGNRVSDLRERWREDVVAEKPNWLCVMIGINDVWCQFESPELPDQISPELFESIYRELLDTSRQGVEGLVLMSPYVIDLNRADPRRVRMDAYGEIVRKLAAEFEAIFVDTQAAFDAFLRDPPAREIAPDRIHPTLTGHLIIARAFLNAVGHDWF